MTFTPSFAEDSCLKHQASSATTEVNLIPSNAPGSRPTTATASGARNWPGTASPSPSGRSTPARDGGHSLDYFTLGSSGIASGHHHAYLPDPWAALGPPAAGAANSLSEKKDLVAGSGDNGDDDELNKTGLVAGAAKFGSKRSRHSSAGGAASSAYVSRSPSSASASSVSIVGSMAEVDETASVSKPAPLRLVRTVTFGAAAEIEQAPALEHHHRPASSHSELSSSSSSATIDYTPPRVTFPEGGLQAWLVVFASFCAMVSVFGLINTAAVFESWFATHQLAEYTASEIGWVFSLYLFIVFFIGIQVGPIFDRHGPRYLVALGSVLSVASVMLLGFCQQYYQILLCYSVLGGLGGALLNTPAYACIAHFFNARRGLATGIATTSGGVGGIAFPILLQQLLPRVGFPWTTRILGFILLGLSIPSNLWLRTRLPLPGVNDRNTEEMGGSSSPAAAVAAADASTAEDDGAASVRTGVTGRSSTRSLRRAMPSVWPDFTIFRDRRYAVAAVGIFFMEWGIFVPLTFIVSYAAAHNESTDQAYVLLSLLNAGSVVGRVLPGLLADKVGRFNVIIVTIFLSSAVVLGVWLPAGDNRAILIAFAVLFGFASGSNLGLIAVCLGQLCEPSQYGRYYSTAMMVASFGTLSSVPIGGAILGDGLSRGGWMGLIIFSGVSYAVALVCYMAARIMAVGWSLKAKF
ncbi:hypothetical protein SCUCBS95973_005634 [Sporothrix curviconia]|uniref:Major facilitator superfamily (MFS) profile domain-containing protein n=1 Tax=Sporothrix curviconia TaxID=1260050 RepID=A0ABP0BYH6_9PEZI